jgi:hypothetical protein
MFSRIWNEMQRRRNGVGFEVGLVVVVLLAGGCTEVTSHEVFNFGAWGLHRIRAEMSSCSMDYSGSVVDQAEAEVRSWADGSNEAAAATRLSELASSFSVVDGELQMSCHVEDPGRSGSAVSVAGPVYVDTHLQMTSGVLAVQSVSGTHEWSAGSVVGQDIEGDLHLVAETGIVRLSMLPLTGSDIHLELVDVALFMSLPSGLPYDLQIWGGPETVMTVEGLGLEQVKHQDGLYAGRSGDESVRVRIDMIGGAAHLTSR